MLILRKVRSISKQLEVDIKLMKTRLFLNNSQRHLLSSIHNLIHLNTSHVHLLLLTIISKSM
jgi:hypothetical protein